MIKKTINSFFSKSFLLFFIFGGITTLIDWGIFALFVYSLNLHYIMAVTFSFTIGNISNFSLNKYLNFKNKYSSWSRQLILFMSVAISALLITIILMWVMVDIFGINQLISRIAVSALMLFYNFLAHKHITFNLLK